MDAREMIENNVAATVKGNLKMETSPAGMHVSEYPFWGKGEKRAYYLDRWLERAWKAAIVAAVVLMFCGAAAGCTTTQREGFGVSAVEATRGGRPVDMDALIAELDAKGLRTEAAIKAHLATTKTELSENFAPAVEAATGMVKGVTGIGLPLWAEGLIGIGLGFLARRRIKDGAAFLEAKVNKIPGVQNMLNGPKPPTV